MAATDPRLQARFSKAGLSMLGPQAGIQLLTHAMSDMTQQCTLVLADVQWARLFTASHQVPALFSEIVSPSASAQPAKGQGGVSGTQPSVKIKDVVEKVSGLVAGMLGSSLSADQVGQVFVHTSRQWCCIL